MKKHVMKRKLWKEKEQCKYQKNSLYYVLIIFDGTSLVEISQLAKMNVIGTLSDVAFMKRFTKSKSRFLAIRNFRIVMYLLLPHCLKAFQQKIF